MRYIMSIAGAVGFALVLGLGLWCGKPPAAVLLEALFAAVSFGLFARLWMGLVLHGLEDALLAKQLNTGAETEKPEEKFPADGTPIPLPSKQ